MVTAERSLTIWDYRNKQSNATGQNVYNQVIYLKKSIIFNSISKTKEYGHSSING